MGEINVLVVVYNKSILDSATLISLANIQGIGVYIADNSTRNYGNSEIACEAGYHYVDMGGNKGLSQAYNAVIEMLEKNDDIICLFDDDTTVGGDYFDVLRGDIKEYPYIDLFAPVVKDGVGIMSPCIFDGVKCRRVETIAQLPQHGVSLINSGLAIRMRVFKNYRYDEGQFLDYIDHAFVRDIAHNDRLKIRIMSVDIVQSFSDSERPGKEAELNRFKIFKQDITVYCKRYGISSFRRCRLLATRRLSLFKKYLFT